MRINAPLVVRAPEVVAPTRAPCTCYAGRLCPGCQAWGATETRQRAASLPALRRKLAHMQQRLMLEEHRLAVLIAQEKPTSDLGWRRIKKRQYETVTSVQSAVIKLATRVAVWEEDALRSDNDLPRL